MARGASPGLRGRENRDSDVRSKRHGAAADAGGVEQGVTDGGSYGHDGSLAGTRRREVFAIEENRFDGRKIAETRNTIAGEVRILDAAVCKLNRFEQSASESLNVGADDLIAQAVGIDDGATFKSGDQADYPEFGGSGISDDFRASGDITSLFTSGSDAETLTVFRLLRRPAEFLPGGLENSAEPCVG